MKFGVVQFPGSNCDFDAFHVLRDVMKTADGPALAQGPRPPGRRLRRPARRLLLRRLPALRGHRPLLPPHAGGQGLRPRAAAASSASATASRSSSSSASCPGPCSGTRTSSSSASTSISGSRTTGRISPGPAAKGQVLRIPIAHFDGNYYAAGPGPAGLERRTARSSSATATPTASITDGGQRQRLARQHRRHPQRGGQRPRPDAPSRSGRRRPSSGARTAGRSSNPSSSASNAEAGRRPAAGKGPLMIDKTDPRPARPDRRRIRAHRRAHRPRAEPDRARHLLGHVVRALRLQELARPPQEAADRRAARRPGPGRERRRRRHRRRPGRRLQDRIPQPPLVHRAVPGRGDGRRRHPPRHLHHGRPADRRPGLAALRPARRPQEPRRSWRASSPASPATATAIGVPTVGGEVYFDPCYDLQPPGQRLLPRPGRQGQDLLRQGRGRRQPGPLRRRQDRAATASTARPWPRPSSARRPSTSGRTSRSATRSRRSSSSRPASRSWTAASSSASRTWAPPA